MDALKDFFDFSKDFKREAVSAGFLSSRTVPKPEPHKSGKRVFVGRDNAEKYKKAELEQLKMIAEIETKPKRMKHNDDESESDDDIPSLLPKDSVDDVFNRYKFNRTLPDLPIVAMKDRILRTIRENPVVILEGATGCGKTTQVPQFILDEAYLKRRSVNIVVTQPRKIAAISIAQRVSKERGIIGFPNLIGYQIGLSVQTNDDTRITFCTTGVLLEKLVASKTLENYTHIILDEVHERSQNMDFLFIVIKQLRHTAPYVRIILMSATIEAAEFAEYFSFYHGPNGSLVPAPVIKVDRKSNFDTKVFYFDDLKNLNVDMSKPFEIDKPEITEEIYMAALQLILVCNRIDYTDGLQAIHKPTILMFLPGIYEIGCMNKYIAESAKILQDDPIVVILHSTVTHDQQVNAFRAPPPGKRIIILATNIAESSITVPDVKYVIDFCLTKNNFTDTSSNITSLQLEWCSRSNCRQRGGRAGRTMDGRVYRLVPKHFYENEMDESSKPEMCRCALENVVLKAKQLNMGTPCEIIALAMDRPTQYDIQNTILLLKETGGLLRTVKGHYSDEDGDLTFIGHVMAALPVNFLVAKLIVIGYCFNVLSECIIIGAGLTTKSVFQQGMKNVVRFYSKKCLWSDGSGSDLIAILNAYRAYVDCKENVKQWADRYYLNERSLSEMSVLIKEITERLARLGIQESAASNQPKWSPAERTTILKVVFAGAFYPHYFTHSFPEKDNREAARLLYCRDACTTVFFTGFPDRYIRPLYVQSIKNLLKPCTNYPENIQVAFDDSTEKVYVTFQQSRESIKANTDPKLNLTEMGPEQVCIEVYKALKLKKSSNMVLDVAHPVDAEKYAVKAKIASMVRGKLVCEKTVIKNPEMFCFPRKYVKNVTGKITHYDKIFNRFCLRSVDEERLFCEIRSELNSPNSVIEEFSNSDDIQVGQVVAALYDQMYYRAKVTKINNGFYNVVLMDVGNECYMDFSELRRLRGVSAKYIDLPPRILECRLALLQPSDLNSARYGWESIMAEFKRLTSDTRVCAEIYSVENGVANVTICVHDRTVQDILIDEGFARTGDESFMSKDDHSLRVKAQALNNSHYEEECDVVEEEMRTMMPCEVAQEVDEPPMALRYIKVQLKGPKSPLERNINTCLHQTNTRAKRVVIEPHSVNSVFLEANPGDTFEKYVVSVNVTENQSRTELTARETSLMPSIPGFGPLMALIFSPYCEFFCDRYKSRYTSILCGLGEHPKNKEAIYGEHDAVFNLDTEIDVTDIENVNTIRTNMDRLLRIDPERKVPRVAACNRNEILSNMKIAIFSLLERQRPLMGILNNFDIGWSKYNRNDVIKAKDMFPMTGIFPPHNILSLAAADSPDRLEQLKNLKENNADLHRTANTDLALLKRAIKCLLCHVDLDSVAELKIHLLSRLHTDREKIISLER